LARALQPVSAVFRKRSKTSWCRRRTRRGASVPIVIRRRPEIVRTDISVVLEY
ncbi:hypothetical protein BaRGS_00016811, partial [Batillaria attramentaria]